MKFSRVGGAGAHGRVVPPDHGLRGIASLFVSLQNPSPPFYPQRPAYTRRTVPGFNHMGLHRGAEPLPPSCTIIVQ